MDNNTKTLVIFNPAASNCPSREELASVMESLGNADISETREAGDARSLAREGAESGCDLIIVGGGDGAINEVANGVMQSRQKPAIGILPLGTGNDLCRALNIPFDLQGAVSVIKEGLSGRIDILLSKTATDSRYCVNVASGGFSGKIGQRISPELKRMWGPLAYAVSALDLLDEFQPYSVTLTSGGGFTETFEAVNIFVANGSFTGGGIQVSPEANMRDGQFELVVVLEGRLMELLGSIGDLLAGVPDTNEVVKRYKTTEVRMESNPRLPVNLDGELFTKGPVSFEIVPSALEFIVGREAFERLTPL
jgi:diacylglycerol kinase (ATP)